ncbi:phage holin family protein [Frankia sp. AgKG'84/4]|uniref:phage holin family protein n=1 Tax=Frankia sp. AgKG'84/4 TaxID=573490 RepID=UPI00200EDA94|nr:phage holin family protein [Frankia sp. AgKG'84/4]MCL9796261.1 phage holin family protein [Frankia sp. AgKG'84/4]
MSEVTAHQPGAPATASAGELVSQLSEQVSRLVRDELTLAQAELTRKGKKAAIGGGLFGGAGVIGVFAVGTLVACAVLGLATALAAWLSALIVGVALLAVTGGLALTGKKELSAATPPLPAEAIEGMKTDVHTIKEAGRR